MLIPGVTTGVKAGSTLQETHVLQDQSAKSFPFPHPVNPLDVTSEWSDRLKVLYIGIYVDVWTQMCDFATKNDLEQVTYTWKHELDKNDQYKIRMVYAKIRMWEKCEKAEPGFCPLKTAKCLCNKLPFIPD